MAKRIEVSYDGDVGRWWVERSVDEAHRRAYRKIADFIRASYTRTPHTIVDYACGAGNLLSLLSLRFPRSRLVGLDGSYLMLGLALRRLSTLPPMASSRISLIRTPLPNIGMMRGACDLVTYCFPNMMPSKIKGRTAHPSTVLSARDRIIAKALTAKALSQAAGVPGRRFDPRDLRANQASLEQGRNVSLNLRRLLKTDGICVRVEYASSRREEMSPAELDLVCFEEGSLEDRVEGIRLRPWFRVVASAYFRSRVLDDVYQQTGDKRDRKGGFLITVLRAV